ncbi:hypothetical protein F4678DRAFT_425159 [Xylaria arbuscula]|nr:hypothetical protein F4678DRAFT_425159 [Xylaria arbuscula]
MYPLNHHDSILVAATRIALQGPDTPGNSGELRHSLDRRRTASYRLSCISEHQKENTRSSDDDYFLPGTQSIKTPLLLPIRRLRRYHQISGKTQSSGDESPVSPLQLDPEQTEGASGSEANHRYHRHVVLSSWQCAAPDEPTEQNEQRQHEALATKPFRLASPGVLEVQWGIIRWTDARSSHIYIEGHKRTISGTGFDGPRSSTSATSSLHSPKSSSPPLGSLSLGNCIPCKPRKPKSDTSGSGDMEKNVPKRKPLERNDVSEGSDLDPPAHENPVESPSIEKEKGDTTPLKHDEQEHQCHFQNSQECALKSCPELYRRSNSVVRSTISRFVPGTVSSLKPPSYTQFDTNRHQHRHRIQETVSKRFRSLREKLRRGRSSSMFSVRPEFPPPPAGKERRYRSRNSNEIWPSSEESPPIYNTPESNKSPVQLLPGALLAASGMRLAAVELDRLTNQSRSTKTSVEVARISSGTDSARSESESSIADITPAVPTNSPSSFLSPIGLANPNPRTPQKPGMRARRQHSRLSEVTTSEEINSPAGSSPISPQALYFASERLRGTLLDTLPAFEADGSEGLIPPPEPEPIQRPDSLDKPHGEASPPLESVVTRIPLDHDVAVGGGIVLPERKRSKDRTPEPRSDETNWSDEDTTEEYIVERIPFVMRPPLLFTRSEPNYRNIVTVRREIAARELSVVADADKTMDEVRIDTTVDESASRSCHPDTWSLSQGEPGDSEPFCPEECVSSRQCGHEDKR